MSIDDQSQITQGTDSSGIHIDTLQPSNTPQNTQHSIQTVLQSLQTVNINSPESQLNATSISDNNGGRIELNQDALNVNNLEKVIKK